MYLKRLLAFLCCFTLVFCLFPSSAFATGGNGNIDGGGGSMGHGTSSNFWNSGNDGVRITVVDASSGTAVSSPLDFSNRTQKTSLPHPYLHHTGQNCTGDLCSHHPVCADPDYETEQAHRIWR